MFRFRSYAESMKQSVHCKKHFHNISFRDSSPRITYSFPMKRTLYLIAYDITNNKRLNQVRYFLKGYSSGGQKSVYECFLTDGELRIVAGELQRLIEDEADRVHIFVIDGRTKTHTLGMAVEPRDPEYFYVG